MSSLSVVAIMKAFPGKLTKLSQDKTEEHAEDEAGGEGTPSAGSECNTKTT